MQARWRDLLELADRTAARNEHLLPRRRLRTMLLRGRLAPAVHQRASSPRLNGVTDDGLRANAESWNAQLPAVFVGCDTCPAIPRFLSFLPIVMEIESPGTD